MGDGESLRVEEAEERNVLVSSVGPDLAVSAAPTFSCMSLLRKSLTHWQMFIFFHVYAYIFNYTCALTYKKYIYCYLQIYSHLIMLLSAVNHEYLYTYIHTQTHSVPHTNKYDHTFTYLHPQVRTCLYFFFFHSFFEARKATLFGKQLMDKMAG